MNTALKGLVPVAILIILALSLLGTTYVIVEAGHVGVVKRLGAVQPEPLVEGFHLKRPFVDEVQQVDVRLIPINAKATAASKDLQTVSTR